MIEWKRVWDTLKLVALRITHSGEGLQCSDRLGLLSDPSNNKRTVTTVFFLL